VVNIHDTYILSEVVAECLLDFYFYFLASGKPVWIILTDNCRAFGMNVQILQMCLCNDFAIKQYGNEKKKKKNQNKNRF
jgi:hypothetical protein